MTTFCHVTYLVFRGVVISERNTKDYTYVITMQTYEKTP